MKTNIYIITHKKFECPNIEGYLPLHVGKEGKKDLGYKGDNTGENISSKNANYCELTGVYWIWKNDKESDIVGISHYRRYFKKKNFRKGNFITKEKIENILEEYDIILPKKEIYRETANEQYCKESGLESDLENIRNIINEKYPEYLEAYDKIMNQNKIRQFNMLICKKELFDSYCNWLFCILFELEKNVDLSQRNDYQKRIYGFLSERLLNVWVEKNKLKIKGLHVINTEEKFTEKLKISLRRIKNGIIYKIKKRFRRDR